MFFSIGLFVYLFEFYGVSTFVGYLRPNQFLYKEFSFAGVHTLIVKNISISNYYVYSSSYILQPQFSVSTVSMSKTVQFQIIQFSIST